MMARGPGNRGAALLLVVVLVGLLTVMVVEFLRESRLEFRTAGSLRDTLQAHALTRSGAAVGSALLLADLADGKDTDHLGELWAHVSEYPVPLGGILIEMEIEDLDGKFPLGSLVDNTGGPKQAEVDAYMRLLEALSEHLKESGLEEGDILDQADLPALVDALIDWIDEDDSGEYEDYEEYSPPNAPLAGLDELYRVEGYGVVPEGYGHSIADAILPYLDTRVEGEINVNTAEAPVLAAFHQAIDYRTAADWAKELDETPAEKSFKPGDYPSVSRITLNTSPLKRAVTSNRFRVRINVSLGDVSYPAEALIERDSQNDEIKTVEWREGWMRIPWRHPRRSVPMDDGGLIP